MLDPVDIEILSRKARNHSTTAVASDLGLSLGEVHRRLRDIRSAWDCRTTLAAVVVAVRRGLI